MIDRYKINKLLKVHYSFFKNDRNKKGLIIKGDGSWVFNQISRELTKFFYYMNIKVLDQNYLYYTQKNSVFFLSRYEFMKIFHKLDHFKGFAYYHGNPKYDNKWNSHIKFIKKNHDKIDRIMVSNTETENLILENNFDKNKLFKIPISVDYALFNARQDLNKLELRKQFKIPAECFVIGSFQKDGEGWGRGLKPKLIKGPDIFIETIKKLKNKIDKLYILLSGPSRGYIQNELVKINIPFRYINFKDYYKTPLLYHLIDLYFIPAREEGGPRALLESFASKTPIVSTNVGQVKDLLINNKNGFKSNSFDTEELSYLILKAYKKIKNNEINTIINNANKTAYQNSYINQKHLWLKFLNGFYDA